MKYIEHPFFSFIYFNDHDGLYWEGQKEIANINVPISMAINLVDDINKKNLDKAANVIKRASKIHNKVILNLQKAYKISPSGALWDYIELLEKYKKIHPFLSISTHSERITRLPEFLYPTFIAIWINLNVLSFVMDYKWTDTRIKHTLSVDLNEKEEIELISLEDDNIQN